MPMINNQGAGATKDRQVRNRFGRTGKCTVQISHLGIHPSEVRLGKKSLSSIQAERTPRDPELLLVLTSPNLRKAPSWALGP